MWSSSVQTGAELSIAGISATKLAKEFGTPTFFIDEVDFYTRATDWNTALKDCFGANAGTVYYAAKAFICTEVARWIKDVGIGIDVCTGGELSVALAGGIDATPGTNIVPTVSGVAQIGNLSSWTDPVNNQTATIVYGIDFENGRQILNKTQSFSVQYEGNVGPGIVLRGEWKNDVDYIGVVETTNYRRDAVIYRPDGVTRYYLAISGSGPNTGKKHNPALIVGPQTPPAYTLPVDPKGHWEYAGEQEFFVAAQISIFDESFVRNTLNVGTKSDYNKFSNIVLAGGRPDTYIAIGQTGTVGTAGTSGTTFVTPGILGYDRPGIFMGLYEDAQPGGTNGRFSIRNGTSGASGTRGIFWDGDTLTIKGQITQTSEGGYVGRAMGAWAAGIKYYNLDQVTYGGYSWSSNSEHTSTNNTLAGTGYPGSGPWSLSPYAAKSIRQSASAQVFTELKNGTLTPNMFL